MRSSEPEPPPTRPPGPPHPGAPQAQGDSPVGGGTSHLSDRPAPVGAPAAGDAQRAGEPRPAHRSRARLALLLYSVAAGLYVLDRLTKLLAEQHLVGHPRTLVPGVLQLQYTENAGGAFGVFGGAVWLFLTATLAVCAVIVVFSFNLPSRPLAVALGLVLGGAMGNLTDRAVRGTRFFGGRVIDFLAFAKSPHAQPVWPVFNLADSAIVVGAGLILLASLRSTAKR